MLVLFDLDGTLTDSAPGIVASFRYALKLVGAPEPPGDMVARVVGPPIEVSLGSMGLGDRASEAVEACRAYYAEWGWADNLMFEGIREMLTGLRDVGVRMAVATSKAEPIAVRVLEKHGLTEFFEVIVGADPGAGRSSKADVVAHTLMQLGAAPADVVMVGDRVHDVEGAAANGIATIVVDWGYGTSDFEEGPGEPSRWIRSWAHSPDELLKLLLEYHREGERGNADHEVLIVGCGPTGLTLASELALAGVDVAVLERRGAQDVIGSRAAGLHSRTIEMFDQRGIAQRLLMRGVTCSSVHFSGLFMDLSDFPTRHNYELSLRQQCTERVLAERASELGVAVYWGGEVMGFAQNDFGVDVQLSGGSSLHTDYLVGCDGARSIVRKSAGIDFPGWDPSISCLIGDVELIEEPEWGFVRNDVEGGVTAVVKFHEGPVRVIATEPGPPRVGTPTIEDISQAFIAARGTDYGMHSPTWISRFTDVTRQAGSYRSGRVLLAGDAAHVHFPSGGQGLNLGVQDAMNLGWKLAQVVKGISPDTFLDTYTSERHPVAARVLRNTMAQIGLNGPGARVNAMREIMVELLQLGAVRRTISGMMSGLDIRYGGRSDHPLLGVRMPDLDLTTARGLIRTFTLLHEGHPVLINLGKPGSLDVGSWADRVRLVNAERTGVWEIPVLGQVPAPEAVLVRPDGYIAWVGDGTDKGLYDALASWFGPPCCAEARSKIRFSEKCALGLPDIDSAKRGVKRYCDSGFKRSHV